MLLSSCVHIYNYIYIYIISPHSTPRSVSYMWSNAAEQTATSVQYIHCVMIWMSLSCFGLFLFIHYFHFLPDPVQCFDYSFPDSVSFHALVFPSHVFVYLSDLSPSMPESVSHHSVISRFLVFSECFLRISFSGIPAVILICIVMNTPLLCNS